MIEQAGLDDVQLSAARHSYATLGFAGPFRALAADAALAMAETLLAEIGLEPAFADRRNRHLDSPLVDALARSAPVARLAAALLDDDLVLWRSHLFVMYPGKGLGWHQDQYLTLLSDQVAQVSVHMALTEARADNCISIVPGSHLLSLDQLGARGFNFIAGTDGGKYGAPNFWRDPGSALEALPMLLQPGEFFIFHPRLLHASRDVTQPADKRPRPDAASAATQHPRVGLALRIATARNTVLPPAFAETLPRPDHCVALQVPD